MEKKNVWSRLLSVDRRILYWILAILIVIPLVRPLGFPIPITETTRKFHDVIQSLPEGSVVVLDNSVGVIAWSEIGPATIAVTKLLIERNFRVIIWSTTYPEVGSLSEQYLLPLFEAAGKQYGKDYVLIGYIPGAVSALATLAKDIHYPHRDFYGTDLETLQILQNVNTVDDVDAVVLSESGGEGGYYVGQWFAPYGATIVDICTGALVSDRMMLYNAGQIKGLVTGARGGAEIELLTGYLGAGVASADALSITHLYLLLLIIVGNIAYFAEKASSGREKK